MAALALAASPGCASRYRAEVAPGCHKTETLVLMAQAVPSADRVPCIANLPAGWSFAEMDIHSGLATFSLSSDRVGDRAVVVTLRRSCPVAGTTEIATDKPGTRRFERVQSLIGGYLGTRTYLFRGGCTTYRFSFKTPGMALVNQASLALGFVSRAEVARLAALKSV